MCQTNRPVAATCSHNLRTVSNEGNPFAEIMPETARSQRDLTA